MSEGKDFATGHDTEASVGYAHDTELLLSYDIIDENDESIGDTSHPVGLKSDVGREQIVLAGDATMERYHSSESTTTSEISSNLLCLSYQLKFWSSKFT